MNFEKKITLIPGCYELVPRVHKDARGVFVKSFHAGQYKELGLETEFQEEFYSVSGKGVLRGLHFQLPPHDYVKTVSCLQGRVFDAVVDLRRGSPAFGRTLTFILDSETPSVLYLPKGVAHGFYTLSDSALMVYRASAHYQHESDSGILWDSAGIAWPAQSPITSQRDLEFKTMRAFMDETPWQI